jgi:hypothetical protein
MKVRVKPPMPWLTAKEALGISKHDISEIDMKAALYASILTSAIAGSSSICQDFEEAHVDPRVVFKMLVMAKRWLRQDGFKVTLMGNTFIEIDWSDA